MKDNITYYRHYADSHNHPKFKMLRVEYGWEGEGRFWALNNMIAAASGCWLDLSQKYIRATIANDLGMTLNEFLLFVKYLEEECDLIVSDGQKITTNEVQENLEKVSHDREKARKRKKGSRESSPEPKKSSPEPKQNQSRTLQERKEKKRKEKDIVISFDDFWDAYGGGQGKKLARERFNKLSPTKKQAAIDGIPSYLAWLSHPDNNWQAKKHASTYLSKESWLDDFSVSGNSKTDHTLPPSIKILLEGINKERVIPQVPKDSGDYSGFCGTMSIFLNGSRDEYENRSSKESPVVLYPEFYKRCFEKTTQHVES